MSSQNLKAFVQARSGLVAVKSVHCDGDHIMFVYRFSLGNIRKSNFQIMQHCMQPYVSCEQIRHFTNNRCVLYYSRTLFRFLFHSNTGELLSEG